MKIKKITKNSYLDALFKLMLFSAIIHILIIIFYSISNLNIAKLNFLDMIGVSLLFPFIENYVFFIIIGTGIMVLLYILFFLDSEN
jgi:hypothetical protein